MIDSLSLFTQMQDTVQEEYTFGPDQKISVLIAYSPSPSLRLHMQLSSGSKGIIFFPSLHMHPYFACASSEGSDETAHMRSLV